MKHLLLMIDKIKTIKTIDGRLCGIVHSFSLLHHYLIPAQTIVYSLSLRGRSCNFSTIRIFARTNTTSLSYHKIKNGQCASVHVMPCVASCLSSNHSFIILNEIKMKFNKEKKYNKRIGYFHKVYLNVSKLFCSSLSAIFEFSPRQRTMPIKII